MSLDQPSDLADKRMELAKAMHKPTNTYTLKGKKKEKKRCNADLTALNIKGWVLDPPVNHGGHRITRRRRKKRRGNHESTKRHEGHKECFFRRLRGSVQSFVRFVIRE